MMKKTLLLSALCLCLLLISGCGASTGLISNQNQLQTNVVLSQNNFTVVKTVTGEASAAYVFGIGGYAQAEAKASAMNQMFQNAELTGSQAIVNAQVSLHAQTILGIYTKVTAYATGTVVEFRDALPDIEELKKLL